MYGCMIFAYIFTKRKTKYGKDAEIIGEVTEGKRVIMETVIGGERLIEPPIADPVPRVC